MLWASCERQHDREEFLEESRDACYQGVYRNGYGDPCKAILNSLYNTEIERDRIKAENARLDSQVDDLSKTIDDMENENDLDELRRQIKQIKIEQRERDDAAKRHLLAVRTSEERQLDEEPAEDPEPRPEQGTSGLDLAAAGGIASLFIALAGVVAAAWKAYKTSGTRADRVVRFARDPDTHEAFATIGKAAARRYRRGGLGRPSYGFLGDGFPPGVPPPGGPGAPRALPPPAYGTTNIYGTKGDVEAVRADSHADSRADSRTECRRDPRDDPVPERRESRPGTPTLEL